MADAHHLERPSRRGRVEATAFAVFAVLHVPGVAVALTHPGPSTPSAVSAAASVVTSFTLWAALTAIALRALSRRAQVPRALLAAALALDTVVLTVSGLSPVRPGNVTAAAVGILAICAAAALMVRPRSLPLVLVPAVVGQGVLLRAVDAGATDARLVADVATVSAASLATAVLIAWLEHERRRGLVALAAAALTDPLTGLLNRRGLGEGMHGLLRGRTERERVRASRLVVVVVDVDRFKSVNDRRGHDVGDAVLVAVARALQDCSREGDLLVRLGGEELAWVSAWPSAQDAAVAAEQLRALVAQRTRELGEPVTLSAGVAAVPDAAPGGTPDDASDALALALTRADRALYRAKAGGRDRVEVAPDEGAEAAVDVVG